MRLLRILVVTILFFLTGCSGSSSDIHQSPSAQPITATALAPSSTSDEERETPEEPDPHLWGVTCKQLPNGDFEVAYKLNSNGEAGTVRLAARTAKLGSDENELLKFSGFVRSKERTSLQEGTHNYYATLRLSAVTEEFVVQGAFYQAEKGEKETLRTIYFCRSEKTGDPLVFSTS